MEDLRTRLLAVIDDLTLLSIHAGIHPAAQAAHATDAERLRAELSKPELQCPWCVRDGRKPRALELQWVCEHCGYRGTADDYEHAEPTLTPKPEPGDLRAALVEARVVIMGWNALGHSDKELEIVTKAYEQSPEIKRIDAALALTSPSALQEAAATVVHVYGDETKQHKAGALHRAIARLEKALNPDGRTP